MSAAFDEPAVEQAAAGLMLRLPRVAHRGKLGEVRASSVGSSMELHDFREYQPGDDLRHIDWNAVARTVVAKRSRRTTWRAASCVALRSTEAGSRSATGECGR